MMKTNKSNLQSGRSLTFTLAIAFLALSMVALLANGVFTLYTSVTRQQETIITQQQLIARDASEGVGGFFEEKYRALESTTEILELPKGTPEQRRLILQSLLATQPSFRQMVLLNASGEEAALASRVSLELSEQFKEQFQLAMSITNECASSTRVGRRVGGFIMPRSGMSKVKGAMKKYLQPFSFIL